MAKITNEEIFDKLREKITLVKERKSLMIGHTLDTENCLGPEGKKRKIQFKIFPHILNEIGCGAFRKLKELVWNIE